MDQISLALTQTTAEDRPVADESSDARTGSFVGNMTRPVHRWYRYSAGFSADWVHSVLKAHPAANRILDPFVGSGTVLIEAEKLGREAVGIESHPLIARIANAKLAWRAAPADVRERAAAVSHAAREIAPAVTLQPSTLLDKCFTPEARRELQALLVTLRNEADEGAAWKLLWLAFLAVIRESSHVGTAQWQYLLPNRRKARVVTPIAGFNAKVGNFVQDMAYMHTYAANPPARVEALDAREHMAVPPGWADLVITSPPYANNYDYADATRLELSVLGEIEGWKDLQTYVRPNLVRACTQHVASQGELLEETLNSARLASIRQELAVVVDKLSVVRESRGGKKPYHLMLAFYFFDMAGVLDQLRRQVRRGGRVCFVIGDSAPYGVHAPVDRWLGDLAVQAGFNSYEFERIRERNTKWKNRKHTVPLHEGRLWIEA